MRQLWCILTAIVLLAACSEGVPERQAAEAAQRYYHCLVDDNAPGFLEGKAGIDCQPAAYCDALLQAVAQYQADVEAKHGGLRQVLVADSHYQDHPEACRDTVQRLVYAFLLLHFADSTQEEIAVPMVQTDGKWLMR